MREKLFRQNYELLEKIAGKLLTDEEPNFYLTREPEWINEYYCKYGAYIDRYDEKLIKVATFYYMDNFSVSNKNIGRFTIDPEITILFNNKLKIARITDFVIDNPKTAMLLGSRNGIFELHFNCTEITNETEDECEYNDYLNNWLQEYAQEIKDNKNFFITKHREI